MRFNDKVLEKFGEVLIDLGKAAMIAGTAALFFEQFRFLTTIGSVMLGLFFLLAGLYSFHELGRRQKETEKTDQNESQ